MADGPHRSPAAGAPLKCTVAVVTLVTLLVSAQIVFAVPPTASFMISDTTLDTGQSVTFTSTASDPDGDIAAREWDFDYTGTFTVDATGTMVSTSYATPGSRSVAHRVTDTAGDPAMGGDGTVDSDISVRSVNVTVPNSDPTASFTVSPQPPHNGDRPVPGQDIRFNATASDPDPNTTLTYAWDFGDGLSSSQEDPLHSYATAGTKVVRLTVRDNQGGSFTTPAQNVIVNSPPVARLNIINSSSEPGQKHNTPLVGQAFVFTGQGLPALPGQTAVAGSSDAEDGAADQLTYEWDLDNDRLYGAEDNPDEPTGLNAAHGGFPTAGQRTAGVRVRDSRGARTTGQLTFRVNSAPNPGFSFEPVAPVVGKQIVFSSTSTDPDGTAADPLAFAWDLDGDNLFGTADSPAEPTSPTTPPVVFNTDGDKTVRLRVTDTGGISRTATRTVNVQLSAPNGAFTSSPDAPLPGAAVTFRSTSTPSEASKSITKAEWDFDYDPSTDTFAPADVDATGLEVKRAFATPGPKTVALKVTEGPLGGYDIVVHTITVNAPPSASFSAAPGSPLTNDLVTFSSTSGDPDGPLAAQDWDLDGDGSFDDASGAIASRAYAVAGTYPVALRVTDAKGATTVASGEVRVAGRPLPPPAKLQVLPSVSIQIAGRVLRNGARLRLLRIRAPKGAKVRIVCQRRGKAKRHTCPKKRVLRRTMKGRSVRAKRFERRLRAGTRITIVISRKGFISRYTRFTMRRGRPPTRADRCIVPGTTKPTRCPEE